MIDSILPSYFEEIIIDTIKRQCLRFREYEKQRQNLFYEPYSKTRKKYDLTAAVLSGFAPDRFKHKNVHVQDLQYGLHTNQLSQPELTTDTAIIQIYSDGAAPLKNKIVQERCAAYNRDSLNRPQFLIIRFAADKSGQLKKIEVIYPNEVCEIIERKTIYERAKLTIFGAVG